LQKFFGLIEHLQFPDHHAYGAKEMKRIKKSFEALENDKKIIITTEKDAVRISDSNAFKESDLPFYYLPIEIEFLNDDRIDFEKKIKSFISNNRPPSILNRGL
jgi:tetraacyldisaccharide 4'-kinase